MSYFVYEGILECGSEAKLEGDEARHVLKSRRLRHDEVFEIQDTQGMRFQARVSDCFQNNLSFYVEKKLNPPSESPLQLELWQAMPREKALKWVLQKGTELGVSRIVVFRSCYSPGSQRTSGLQTGMKRWQRICLEACKQSGRLSPPNLQAYSSLEDAFSQNPLDGRGWILSFDATSNPEFKGFTEDPDTRKHRLLVGPEGGWHRKEVETALVKGMKPVSLGSRVMRSETAAVSALAILQYLYGDLGWIASEMSHELAD